MLPITFLVRWNGILKKKKLTIQGFKIDTESETWKWERPEIVTAQFEYACTDADTLYTRLETRYAIIANTIVLGLIHNDKQMATITFTIDEDANDLVCRIGKFTNVGEFNEMFYEEPDVEERANERRAKIVFGIDMFPDDLFEECC